MIGPSALLALKVAKKAHINFRIYRVGEDIAADGAPRRDALYPFWDGILGQSPAQGGLGICIARELGAK